MVCCFGSLNIDMVYRVPRIVRPGETLLSQKLEYFSGGKGLNQSIALTRAGLNVRHAGKIGPDGLLLLETLRAAGVDASLVAEDPEARSGHALIQVDGEGQNAILLYGGANQSITEEDIQRVLAALAPGDLLLLQNELNATEKIIRAAAARGLSVALNAAPLTPRAKTLPFELLDYLFVNEIEGEGLTGRREPAAMLEALVALGPRTAVLTLGALGARAARCAQRWARDAVPARVADTTAAGDTYTGFFLAEMLASGDVGRAMTLAAGAAAVTVSRPGAAESIPTMDEVRRIYGI